MSSHPLNLFIRFILEIVVLITVGMWGWHQDTSWLRYIYALGLPAVLATIWGIFAVPNDPCRSGKAPVPTQGWVRLIIELGFFAFGTWILYDMEYFWMSLGFGSVVFIHYAISYDRIKWLLK